MDTYPSGLREWSAKPLFTGSNPVVSSMEKQKIKLKLDKLKRNKKLNLIVGDVDDYNDFIVQLKSDELCVVHYITDNFSVIFEENSKETSFCNSPFNAWAINRINGSLV